MNLDDVTREFESWAGAGIPANEQARYFEKDINGNYKLMKCRCDYIAFCAGYERADMLGLEKQV